MWIVLALVSAFFLGLYDIFKKKSLEGNNVLTILFLNTLFCALLFIPFIVISHTSGSLLQGTPYFVPHGGATDHLKVLIKSVIVLASWTMGYYAIKNLPITIAGPVNATRPVLVLIGAVALFGERLNLYQWTGIALALTSFLLLSITGRKEGIAFSRNKWIWCSVGATVMGAVSGLYDKQLMREMEPMFVQSWYVVYQCLLMGLLLFRIYRKGIEKQTPFRWVWSIPFISLFLSVADFAYFYALSFDESMISIVSMLRRCSVVVSFIYGAVALQEKNIKAKVLDMILVLIGLVFLVLGSR
ncbi:MAG: DMT family transporter [Bacteroidales bacterium]